MINSRPLALTSLASPKASNLSYHCNILFQISHLQTWMPLVLPHLHQLLLLLHPFHNLNWIVHFFQYSTSSLLWVRNQMSSKVLLKATRNHPHHLANKYGKPMLNSNLQFKIWPKCNDLSSWGGFKPWINGLLPCFDWRKHILDVGCQRWNSRYKHNLYWNSTRRWRDGRQTMGNQLF